MKRGYIRLLFFELFIMIILILNNFVSSILNGYIKAIFLAILLVVFKLCFGFEKDRHRYWKSICIEVIIFVLGYFLIYYLSGLLFSFYKPINYYTISGITKYIIPLIITIILEEILRYLMLTKSEGSKVLIIFTCSLFVLFDLLNVYSIMTFKTPYTIFMFIALSLLPTISKNVVCSYMALKSGYKPPILYSLVMTLYTYLLPIVPNPNEYIYAVFQLIAPFILLYRVYVFFKFDRDEDIVRKYHKVRFIAFIPSTMIILFLVYITSGYFYYHAIVIGSGSMVPNIYKGDVVVIEKIDRKKYDNIEIGQVIAYHYKDRIIVHRLVKKIKVNNENIFYTKGDANNDIDNYKITEDMIYGIVNTKIPYIGYPTVWLNNL
jgi:signal peptidase